MDMQKLVDAMNAAGQHERSNYHMTLGAAIKWLSEVAPSLPISFSTGGAPGDVDSYRGYYSDLAFPTVQESTVGKVLANLRSALVDTFEGYKGGDFRMDGRTPLWVSEYGCAGGDAVMDFRLSDAGDCVVVVTKHID